MVNNRSGHSFLSLLLVHKRLCFECTQKAGAAPPIDHDLKTREDRFASPNEMQRECVCVGREIRMDCVCVRACVFMEVTLVQCATV